MIRTKRLIQAARVIAGERMADTSEEAVLSVMTNPEGVYRGLMMMGYRWSEQRGLWVHQQPRIIQRLIRAAQLASIDEDDR